MSTSNTLQQSTDQAPARLRWWDDAVVYQVYVRSFQDSNADGLGDLRGIISRLPYLEALGVDAIWLNPCYPSPQRDHGYDIADYFNIEPDYGTLADLDELIDAAHSRGMKVLMDMVANHCSSAHEWFRAAQAGDEAAQARFVLRPFSSDGVYPNNWESVFSGAAWSRLNDEPDAPWYYHAFDSSQPNLNWHNPEVHQYFANVLRFWYARGVDGFRIDVGHGMYLDQRMRDNVEPVDGQVPFNPDMWDQPEVHDLYREWHKIGEEFGGKYLVGEVWVPSIERLERYTREGELDQTFTFELLVQPWLRTRYEEAIRAGLTTAGGRPAWVLSNHDVHRTVTRYGQDQSKIIADPTDMIAAARQRGPVDLALGTERARAAIALLLALPGTAYLYQGEELGLPEVLDLPDEAREDPMFIRSGGKDVGRDGCRVPLPWNGEANFGFSPAQSAPWLPQPHWFADFSVDAEERSETSMLKLYRSTLALRSKYLRGAGAPEWIASAPDVLCLRRGDLYCVTNFASTQQPLPEQLLRQSTVTLVLDTNSSTFDRQGAASFNAQDTIGANSTRWYVAQS